MIPASARKTTPTARGHKSTGITTVAASYDGAIRTRLFHMDGRDCYSVELMDWPSGNVRKVLSSGYLSGDVEAGVPCSNMREFDRL